MMVKLSPICGRIDLTRFWHIAKKSTLRYERNKCIIMTIKFSVT